MSALGGLALLLLPLLAGLVLLELLPGLPPLLLLPGLTACSDSWRGEALCLAPPATGWVGDVRVFLLLAGGGWSKGIFATLTLGVGGG